MEPYIPKKDKKLFYKYLKRCTNYFEFGSGGSTYQAFIRSNVKHIYSVESDQEWQNKLKSNDTIRSNIDKITFIFIDIDAQPNTWGYPGENSTYADWIKYSRALIDLDPKISKSIDYIMIDGRFRVACALNCFKVISPKTQIAFDDFLDRDHYHIILDYYDIVEKADRLVILKKKKNIQPPNEEIITKYESIPN